MSFGSLGNKQTYAVANSLSDAKGMCEFYPGLLDVLADGGYISKRSKFYVEAKEAQEGKAGHKHPRPAKKKKRGKT